MQKKLVTRTLSNRGRACAFSKNMQGNGGGRYPGDKGRAGRGFMRAMTVKKEKGGGSRS